MNAGSAWPSRAYPAPGGRPFRPGRSRDAAQAFLHRQPDQHGDSHCDGDRSRDASVTLQRSDGDVREQAARNPQNLERAAVGDHVIIAARESLVITVSGPVPGE